MQEFDPLGIGSYMRSRMREILGADILGTAGEPFDVPRFALNEPSLLSLEESPPFYVNPDVDWAFPESEMFTMPPKGPAQISERSRGHRVIPGVGTEILESTNTRPSRSPRRLFRVDVTENDDFYFLRADLSGMTKENVKITVDENQNLISINVEPPKDDFFGLYKSPLESQFARSGVSEIKIGSEAGEKEEEAKVPEEHKSSQEQAEVKQPESSLSHKKEVCHLIERSTQSMTRTLKMPKAVDMSKIEAEMREGLLVVKFAKKAPETEEHHKHAVEIK